MENLVQQLINGISLGSIYALIALGYTMVYGVIKLINFAHGDIYMVGAYLGYALIQNVGLGLFPSILISMLFCAILGVVIEKIAYKPLRGATRVATLITAIGVSYLLQNVMIYIMGPQVKAFPTALVIRNWTFGGVTINSQQILIFLTTVILMIALQVIVKYTKMGKAMRAVSTDPEAAQLMGINVDNVISFTFVLGSSLAGAAGVLVGIYYNSISPLMGVTPGLKAFVAAVFGGIGIIPGAMVGGYVIGIIETLVSAYGGSMFKDAVVYLILIIILIVKPSGIFGKNTKEKVQVIMMKQLNKTNLGWLILIALMVVVLFVGVSSNVISPFYQITLVTILINVILAIGLNLVIGFSGQFSLGHAGFMAIGAYSGAIIGDKIEGLPGFFAGLFVGMFISIVVALIVGIPTLRLKGDYLAIATLGVAEIIRILILNLGDLTNGARGISGISFPFESNMSFIMVLFLIVVVTSIITINYIHSSPGRATIAIREDEIAAESMGVNATTYKVIAFMIGAATASIAGSLYGTYFSVITPGDFTFQKSIDVLIIVVFGGIGSVTGTIVAAVVLGVLNTYLQSFGELRMIFYSLAIIAIMVFRPGGLLGNREFTMSSLMKRFAKKDTAKKEVQ